MTERSIALFIHLLGVITLFIAMGLIQRAGQRVRSSSTIEEMRLWLSLAGTTRPMFPSALLVILGSGLYMAGRSWTFDTPWIVVAIVSIVLMGVVGGAVVGRGIAAMGRVASSTASLTPELSLIAGRPTPWVVSTALNGMAIGLLWLMVSKPGWTQSIAVVAVLSLVGALAGFAGTRPKGSTAQSL